MLLSSLVRCSLLLCGLVGLSSPVYAEDPLEKMGVDKMGVDKMGVDKMGVDKMGGNEPYAHSEDALKKISGDQLHRYVNTHKFVVLGFFAEWCGHCKTTHPEFKKAAEIVKEMHPDVAFLEVDGPKESGLMSMFKIKGYPTILTFKRSMMSPKRYDGVRKADALAAMVDKAMRMVLTMVEPNEVERKTTAIKGMEYQTVGCLVVATFKPKSKKKLELLDSIAREFEPNSEDGQLAGASFIGTNVSTAKESSITFYRLKQNGMADPDDGNTVTYSGNEKNGLWKASEIRTIVTNYLERPIVVEWSRPDMEAGEQQIVAFIHPGDLAKDTIVGKIYSAASNSKRNHGITFVFSDGKDASEIYAEAKFPTDSGLGLVYLTESDEESEQKPIERYFIHTDFENNGEISDFLDGCVKRTQPTYRACGKKVDSGMNIRFIECTEYDEITKDDKKLSVVVECSMDDAQCKENVDVMRSVADQVMKNPKLAEDVIVAFINLQENDLPATGSPGVVGGIFIYGKGRSGKEEYTGPVNKDDILNFIIDEKNYADEL